jgi:hypothetical protein
VFGVILLLLVFSSLPTQTTSSAYDDADAYEVYAAILPSEWPLRVAHAKQLVIRRETKSYQMCLKPDSEIQAKVGPAIAAYVKLIEREWLLQPRLSFTSPHQFLEAGKFDALMSQGGWLEYYRQYPESGGLIEFSAVGFNVDKTTAVVYMGHSCGMLCGGGTFHVLEKSDGKWKPFEWKGSWCSWVS